MAKDRFGYEEFGVGMLIGLVFGAGLGLLLAPQSGAATRKQISDTAVNLKDSAVDLVEKAVSRVWMISSHSGGSSSSQS